MNCLVRCVSCIFLIILLLASCDEHEPSVVTFCTIVAEPGYDAGLDASTEFWVFATDEAGVALDGFQITAEGTFTLEGRLKAGSKFTLHRLWVLHIPPPNPKRFALSSYTHMEFGSTWHFYGSPHSIPVNTPTATVEIENFAGSMVDPWPPTWRISSLDGDVTRTATQIGPTLQATFFVKEASDFVVSALKNNTCYYELMTGVQAASTRTVTLKPMDKLITLNYPGNTSAFLYFTGYYAGDDTDKKGYINSEVASLFSGVPPVQMGYADGFDKYRTSITYGVSSGSKSYSKLGSRLETQPAFDDPTVTLASENISNFSATLSIPFHNAQLLFVSTPTNMQVVWYVSVEGDGSHGTLAFSQASLPAEIISAHPDFILDDANFVNVVFYQYKDDFRYQDYLKYSADTKNALRRSSNEYFYYYVYE
jgi:hypothetical protein